MAKQGRAVRRRDPGAEPARPALGARRPRAPGARPAAHPPGHDAEPAEHPAGAGERQVAGQQDQLDHRQHRAAVAPAAGPGDHHLPRRAGGGVGRGGLRPDQRAAAAERQEPAPGQRRGARADGARRVRHRHGASRERGADRDHRGQPADRRRGQEAPGRGREAADRVRGAGCARPWRRHRRGRRRRRARARLRPAERDHGTGPPGRRSAGGSRPHDGGTCHGTHGQDLRRVRRRHPVDRRHPGHDGLPLRAVRQRDQVRRHAHRARGPGARCWSTKARSPTSSRPACTS